MESGQISAVVSYIGSVVQLVGALMLVALFALLRRFMLRRAYFHAWTLAWASIAVGLVAVVLRHHLPQSSPLSPSASGEMAKILPFVYHLGKLLGFALFVSGTRMYLTGKRGAGVPRWVFWLAATYAFAAVELPWGVRSPMFWQSPLAVAAYSACGVMLVRQRRHRHTLGSISASVGFFMTALLWLTYALLLSQWSRGGPPVRFEVIGQYNAYFDLLCSIVLGYAMVMLLMEDAKREVDDAQAELRVVHDQLRRAALYDTLTDSLNRRAFVEGVGLDMAKSTRGTVAVLDLDNLKAVNDAFGHAAGDQLLRVCADTLRGGLRASDKLYRWGGDEFLVILPGAPPAEVQQKLESLLARAVTPAFGAEKLHIALEASVGVESYANGEELAQAIERADAAMYRQKAQRRVRRGALPTPPGVPALPSPRPTGEPVG